mgnify:CR=1 FL=1
MNAYAVIDIGGTAIKYGCATEEGQFLEKASCPTQVGEGGIPEKVIAIVQNMASRHALAGVAIDTAGIVRPGEDGEIVFAGEATFPGYSGTKLGRLVREAVHLPVLVENDVNAAALGEAWLGAARGASSAFMITVGTNLGGCFVQQGRIWHGASFSAGEIGYLLQCADHRADGAHSGRFKLFLLADVLVRLIRRRVVVMLAVLQFHGRHLLINRSSESERTTTGTSAQLR